jgi:hypothetical protein
MKLLLVAFAACAAWCLTPAVAGADVSTIKRPGAHPRYLFEAEPHAIVAPFDDFTPGVGFRGTFNIVDDGFIRPLNDSVGLGFGLDWTENHVRVPVVMQWNFWLSRNWSVFGEPGGLLDFRGSKTRALPALYAGGRFHFTEHITLTMRVGHPTASVGVSFLL